MTDNNNTASQSSTGLSSLPAEVLEAMQQLRAFREGQCSFPSSQFDVVDRFLFSPATASVEPPKKPFAGPGAWFSTDILGKPMRKYAPGKWENAVWPSDVPAASPASQRSEPPRILTGDEWEIAERANASQCLRSSKNVPMVGWTLPEAYAEGWLDSRRATGSGQALNLNTPQFWTLCRKYSTAPEGDRRRVAEQALLSFIASRVVNPATRPATLSLAEIWTAIDGNPDHLPSDPKDVLDTLKIIAEASDECDDKHGDIRASTRTASRLASALPGWTIKRTDKAPFRSITVTSPDGKRAALPFVSRNPEIVFFEFADALLANGWPDASAADEEKRRDFDAAQEAGRVAYTNWCDAQRIHSNRLLGWNELSADQRASWVSRARVGSE